MAHQEPKGCGMSQVFPSSFHYSYFFFSYFKTDFHYETLATLELAIWIRLYLSGFLFLFSLLFFS